MHPISHSHIDWYAIWILYKVHKRLCFDTFASAHSLYLLHSPTSPDTHPSTPSRCIEFFYRKESILNSNSLLKWTVTLISSLASRFGTLFRKSAPNFSKIWRLNHDLQKILVSPLSSDSQLKGRLLNLNYLLKWTFIYTHFFYCQSFWDPIPNARNKFH